MNSERLKLEVKRARVPFTWLLFLILAFAVAMAIIFQNLNFERPFSDRYKVDVAFDSVKGVFPGQHPVRIAGVQVGVVSDLRLEDGKGIATLSLEPRYAPIYRDARVRIRPQTPLQDMYVSIEDRGSKRAGELRPGDPSLPADNTVTPVDVSRVLNTFEPDVRKRLATLLDGMGAGLRDGGRDLRTAFAEIAPFLDAADRVTEAMATRKDRLRRVVTNFGSLADLLAERDRQLRTLVTSGDETLGALARTNGPLAQTIAELPPTMRTLRGSFQSVRAAEEELDPALRALLPAAERLESGLAGLERFSTEATPAFADLREPLRRLRPLALALRPTAGSLESAFARLRPQAPRLDTITRTTVPCLDEAQRFFQHTLSVTKFGNAFGAYPRGNLSQGGTNVDGLTKDHDLKPIRQCYETGSGR